MTETAPDEAPLTGLAGAVDVDQVHALLLSRAPDLLDPTSRDHQLYRSLASGYAVEVSPYAGTETTLSRWQLAVWTVTLGVAASIEAALFPLETRHPETPLSLSLQSRYELSLERLRGRLPDDPDGPPEAGQPPSPRGNFPAAPRYPSPALPFGYPSPIDYPGQWDTPQYGEFQ